MMTITDEGFTPDELTVSSGVTMTLVNESDHARTVVAARQCPEPEETGKESEGAVFLPLILTRRLSLSSSSDGFSDFRLLPSTSSLEETTFLSSSVTIARSSSTMTTTAFPAQEKEIPFDAGEHLWIVFHGEGTWCLYDKESPELQSNITVEDPEPTTYPLTVQLPMNDQAAVNLRYDAVVDPNSTDLSFYITSQPEHGSVLLESEVLTYTPNLDYTGDDTLTYTVDDGSNTTVEGTITFEVLAPTTPPLAGDQTVTVPSGQEATLDLRTLVGNPGGDPLTYALEIDGVYGEAVVDGSTMTYRHKMRITSSGKFADEVFYSVTNEQGEQAIGSIVFMVSEKQELQLETALVADDCVYPLYINSSTTFDLSTLVYNPGNSPLTFEVDTTTPVSGEVQLQGSKLSFTPEQDYTGMVGFSYSVSDGQEHSDAGTIIFDVSPLSTLAPQIITDRAVRLVIEPSSALFTQVGETRTFTLHGYNSLGQETTLDGDIAWDIVSQDSNQSLKITLPPTDTTRVLVTAQDTVGYAQLKAEWGGIPSRSATIMAAELRPGVTVVPDSAVLDEPAFVMPAELGDSPTRSDFRAWLESQPEDYILPQRSRVVLDISQLDKQLQAGDLVTSAGVQSVHGRVISSDDVMNGTEIIYETVPVTQVLDRAQFKGEYGSEDILRDGDEIVSDIKKRTSLANLAQDTKQGETIYRTYSPHFEPPEFVFPCNPLGTSASIGDSIPVRTLSGKSIEDFFRSISIFKDSKVKSNIGVMVDVKRSASCNLTLQIVVDLRVSVELEIEKGGNLSHFAIFTSTKPKVSSKVTIDVSRVVNPKIAFELQIDKPMARLRFVKIFLRLKLGASAGASIQNGIEFELKKEIQGEVGASWVLGQFPTGNARFPGLFDLPETTLNPKKGVSIEVADEVYIGIGAMVGFKVLGAEAVLGGKYQPHRFFADFFLDNRKDIRSLFFGKGTYGWGPKTTVDFDIKGMFLGAEPIINDPIYNSETGQIYPIGKAEPKITDENNNDLDNWCKRDNPDSYSDTNVNVQCRQEEDECITDPRVMYTKYYRNIAVKPGGKIQRLFTFEGKEKSSIGHPYSTIKYNPLFDHITQLDVRLVESDVEQDGICEKQSEFTRVGDEGVRLAGTEETEEWVWSWDYVQAGRYKLVSFTRPLLMNLPGTPLGIRFHLNDNKDEFTVQVGEACQSEDSDDGWVLVDTDDDDVCYRHDGARSYWDPQVHTFDGVHYLSLALGEFIYAKDMSNQSELELQVRQGRLPGKPPWASYMTAAAFRANGHTYEVRLPDDIYDPDLTLLLDGVPADLPAGDYQFTGTTPFTSTNPMTGTSPVSPLIKVTPPVDGTLLRVHEGKSIEVWTPAPGFSEQDPPAEENTVWVHIRRRGTELAVLTDVPTGSAIRGMYGNKDGDSSNDLADRDGTVMGKDDIKAVEEAWRNTERATSLFTYAPGEGPETFNVIQDEEKPGRDDLIREGYVLAIMNLLRSECGVDPSTVSSSFIEGMAFELAAGRTVDELIAGGLCDNVGLVEPVASPPAMPTDWNVTASLVGGDMFGISCPSDSFCTTLGMCTAADCSNGIPVMSTVDGGASWTLRSLPTEVFLIDVSCPTETTCFLVGYNGSILKSDDGGLTWQYQDTETIQGLLRIACLSESKCLAVGTNGTVLTSDDRGETWVNRSSGTVQNLVGIHCLDDTTCIGAGLYGDVIISTDGGSTWKSSDTGVEGKLLDVLCLASDTYVAIGEHGVMKISSDGGATWNDIRSGVSSALNSIVCPGRDTCIVVGDDGTLLTSDSEATIWTQRSVPTDESLYDISCSTATDCVVVSSGGTLLVSSDGGDTWSIQSSSIVTSQEGVLMNDDDDF